MTGTNSTRRLLLSCLITLWVLDASELSADQTDALSISDYHGDPPTGAAPSEPATLPAESPLTGVTPVTISQAPPASLLLETEHAGLYLPAPTLETDILVRVTGIVARTRVRQRFSNPTEWWVEGMYIFPLPEKAAVDSLEMRVGERRIEGRIEEKQEAERTYQKAKAAGQKASLVSQQRPNVFKTAVANLGPHEEVEVILEFQNRVRYDRGVFSLRLPTVVNPRYEPPGADARINGPGIEVAGFAERLAGLIAPTSSSPATPAYRPPASQISSVSRPADRNPITLAIELHPGFPLAALESPSHKIVSIESAPGQYLTALDDTSMVGDRDFELVWKPDAGRTPRSTLFTEKYDGDIYALLMVLPPAPEHLSASRLPRETVFVIDTSGSMHGASIEQAKRALLLAIDRLEPIDSFNIIQFNSKTRQLFPRSVLADFSSLEAAREYVGELEANGGTEMLPAFEAALSFEAAAAGAPATGGLRQVIFITDGSVSNERELFGYLERNLGSSRLFTVGIGAAPNTFFMREAARAGRGSFTYISAGKNVDRKMLALFEKLDAPTLSDLEVHWHDPTAEVYPEQLPDLYAGEPLIVVARFGELGNALRITGTGVQAPWSESVPLPPASKRSGIGKLWAREKISQLMDGIHRGVPPEDVRQAVLVEALGHHLVSRYTSLVAVDLTPSRPTDLPISSRKIPLALPAGWTPPSGMVGSLPQTGTAAPLLLSLGLLAIGSALLLLRRRTAT